jgi:hypothetical protein
MAGAFPRLVVVRRRTMNGRHATRGQAEFYLRQRGQSMDSVEAEHGVVRDVVSEVQSSAPDRWRRTAILRDDLNRFLFEPSDVIPSDRTVWSRMSPSTSTINQSSVSIHCRGGSTEFLREWIARRCRAC